MWIRFIFRSIFKVNVRESVARGQFQTYAIKGTRAVSVSLSCFWNSPLTSHRVFKIRSVMKLQVRNTNCCCGKCGGHLGIVWLTKADWSFEPEHDLSFKNKSSAWSWSLYVLDSSDMCQNVCHRGTGAPHKCFGRSSCWKITCFIENSSLFAAASVSDPSTVYIHLRRSSTSVLSLWKKKQRCEINLITQQFPASFLEFLSRGRSQNGRQSSTLWQRSISSSITAAASESISARSEWNAGVLSGFRFSCSVLSLFLFSLNLVFFVFWSFQFSNV